MVYIEDWQDFVGLAEELYRAAPLQVRTHSLSCAAHSQLLAAWPSVQQLCV